MYLGMNGYGIGASQGDIFCVKPYSGDDNNSGLAPVDSLKTVAEAYDRCTTNRNDIVLLFSEGNTSAATTDYWTSKLTWDKDLTHLIGVCAPTRIGMRSRISQLSTTTGINGLLTISGDSCVFANFLIHQGLEDATSQNAITVSGTRNYFKNVNVQGLLGQAQASAGALAQVTLSGAEENTFEECVFGADTVGQGANSCITMASDSRDNIFKGCYFVTCATDANFCFVRVADNCALGFTLLENCVFINSPTAAGAVTAVTLAIGPSKSIADLDGVILVSNAATTGVTDMGVGGAVLCAPNCGSATGITSTDIAVAVAPT
jgi:hypothetical protein